MLDNLTDYMSTTQVTAGRDGNINSLLRIAKEFDAIRQSYKGIAKDLEAEQQAHELSSQSKLLALLILLVTLIVLAGGFIHGRQQFKN